MALSVGDLVGGRYALEHLIGSGGMGDVFRAKDRILERAVAVKLVYTGDPRKRAEAAKSFLREARISAAVAHPNVVQILDFGIHDSAVPFMVLELLEGEPLANVLGRGDAMTFEWVVHVALQVLDGLSAAHAAGVVHRDLKPENIFLVHGRDGLQAKILDFGISKIIENDPPEVSRAQTTTGKVLGTPAYMSPEQARGQANLDKRTDVYSLGVVLYELISGSMPFYADNSFDLLTKIVHEEAVALDQLIPDVDRPLAVIVQRAMSKNPAERYANASEMRAALQNAASAMLNTSASRRLGERVRPPSWRKQGNPKSASNSEVQTLPSDVRFAGSNQQVTELIKPQEQDKRARARTPLLAGTAVIAALSGVALASTLLTRTSANAPQQHFIVVHANGPAAATSINTAMPAAPEAQAEEEPVQQVAATTQTKAKNESTSTVSLLTRSFKNQKGGIVRCVNQHAETASRTPDLGVRLELDKNGRVLSARATPPALENDPLGACIASAAQAMSFPAPGMSMSLQVPLTARKGAIR